MASTFVSGTYQSYKAGTEKVLHWLYENAQQCAYDTKEIEQTDEEDEGDEKGHAQPERKKKSKPKSKPKKGKGSKAKGSGKAKAKKSSSSTNPGVPKYVSVNEYPALAEAIASSSSAVKIPVWVTAMIEEVISGRKKCAQWFTRQASVTTRGAFVAPDINASNVGHRHFITVLEKVLAILKGIQGPIERSDEMDLDEKDPLDRFNNIFDALEVEPDTEHTMTEPTVPRSHKPDSPNVVYEVEHSEEETLWLIYCFFEDFNIAREHLKGTWTAYKNGVVDLTTVALSTNTAFELFKRAEEELLLNLRSTLPSDLMRQIKGYKEIQGLLYFTTAETRGVKPEKKSAGDPYNYNLFDVADWTGLPVYIILDSFLEVVRPGSIPVCKEGFWGALNLNEDTLNPVEKFTQDKIFLLERLIPEFIFLMNVKDPRTKKGVKFPAEDELTTGILEMIRTKEIPTWVVLSLQVQLDIHYMLLNDIGRPHSELTTAVKQATNTLKAYQKFSENMHIVNWPESNDDLLNLYLMEWRQWVLSDILDPLRVTTFAQIGEPKRGNFVLLKAHPVLCGMMLFRLNLNMQHSGIALSNAWGALPNTLHLYNACLSEQLLESPWMDMEAIIIANTASRIFVGNRPSSPQEYLKRFLLVMGHSSTLFSSNRRSSNMAVSKTGPRQMLKESVIAEIYGDRYLRYFESRDAGSQNSGFTLAAIEKLLEEAAVIHETAHTNEQTGLLGGVFKTLLMQSRGDKSLISRFAKSRKLTTIQFLTTLEASMGHESFAFNVDYFSLHMRCYQLLRTIKEDMDSAFIKYIGPGYIEKESQLPFLVGYIFQVVAGSSKAGGILMPGVEHKSQILTDVSGIIERLIRKEGEEEIEKVKRASRTFGGLKLEKHYVSPTLKTEDLEAAVQAFNKLQRNETTPNKIPTGHGPNHWHFSVRSVHPRVDPPDLVFLISPENALTRCSVPKKGSPILSLLPSDKVDLVVFLILNIFVVGVLEGHIETTVKSAPWTWSCNDAELAKNVERKLNTLGVRKELCTVQIAPEEHNELSDDRWNIMRNGIISRTLRSR